MSEARSAVFPPRPRALTIAGSDSGGGAGIQADLKTFSMLGVFGMTAITAVTVQNTRGVLGYDAVRASTVGDQIRAVATDIGVDAAKTGMLANASIVRAVARAVADAGITELVVDPVSVSKHGFALLDEDAADALRERILPLAALVTPNLSEAGALARMTVASRDDMRRAADTILDLGPRAVLVKGGHLAERGEAADLFLDAASGLPRWLVAERIETSDTHGTGCTLSAAITAHLAMGRSMDDAVDAGKAFVTEAIRHALNIGEGIGPVDQLWPLSDAGRA